MPPKVFLATQPQVSHFYEGYMCISGLALAESIPFYPYYNILTFSAFDAFLHSTIILSP